MSILTIEEYLLEERLRHLENILKFKFKGIRIEKLYFTELNKVAIVIENTGVVTEKEVNDFLEEFKQSITNDRSTKPA